MKIIILFFLLNFNCFANKNSIENLSKHFIEYDLWLQRNYETQWGRLIAKKIDYLFSLWTLDFLQSEYSKACQFCLFDNNFPGYEKFKDYNNLNDQDKFRLLTEAARPLLSLAYKECVLNSNRTYRDLSKSYTGWGLIFSCYLNSFEILQKKTDPKTEFYEKITAAKNTVYDAYEWLLSKQLDRNQVDRDYELSKIRSFADNIEYFDRVAENHNLYK